MMSVIINLSVDLSQHNVDTADGGDDIGDHLSLDHLRQRGPD